MMSGMTKEGGQGSLRHHSNKGHIYYTGVQEEMDTKLATNDTIF